MKWLKSKRGQMSDAMLTITFLTFSGGLQDAYSYCMRGKVFAKMCIRDRILTALPELLRGLNDYRMLIYAIVLIVMMIFNSSPKVLEKRAVLKEKFRNKKNTAKEAA